MCYKLLISSLISNEVVTKIRCTSKCRSQQPELDHHLPADTVEPEEVIFQPALVRKVHARLLDHFNNIDSY